MKEKKELSFDRSLSQFDPAEVHLSLVGQEAPVEVSPNFGSRPPIEMEPAPAEKEG